MSQTNYRGIDYGRGQANIDRESGIRFGVIHQAEVCQAWGDESEAEYGDPQCPECAGTVVDSSEVEGAECDWYCAACEKSYWGEQVYPDMPLGFSYNAEGYVCEQGGDDCDIFITKSPYYTRAQFCSPCAPGACYLMNPCDTGEKAYCFGHDWFEDGVAPYPVYRVSDDTPVLP